MRAGATNSEAQTHGGVFPTTHWSVVLMAGRQDLPDIADVEDELSHLFTVMSVERAGHFWVRMLLLTYI